MFKKVLIANRGEIALRILRACKELSIAVVAVYSEEDRDQLHVKFADEAYCIGPARAKESYLHMTNILSVATQTGCDAIHPGYGFLSENPDFARVVEDLGMKFIGPSAKTIERMGDKLWARNLMLEHGVPLVPGSQEEIRNLEEARAITQKIGYPILVKASRGGGGKGMRRVYSESELEEKLAAATSEAQSAFGNGAVYIEKLIVNPKHIEIQIMRDSFGKAIHLGERHCSIQRNNQKMLEEAPYSKMTDELREKMGEIAVRVAHISDYENVGTIEFILDDSDQFYFIEMNTRLQVEHPVTEMVTNVDLVKEQIRIAAGLPLRYEQKDIVLSGHAIELRVNAESPGENFRPSTGTVRGIYMPGGFHTRFDSYLYVGAKVSPYYDSMLGKIIVRGNDRMEAIKRMRRAVEETIIEGIETNLAYQYSILHRNSFIRDSYDTGFIESNHEVIMDWIKKVEEEGVLDANGN